MDRSTLTAPSPRPDAFPSRPAPVEFGYGLITCQLPPGEHSGWTALYRDALTLAEDAERYGYDSVWTSEHHFVDDGYLPSVLLLSAAIAARTSRIKIGTGVLLAPLYHPVRLAEDVATADLISQGRLVLGLGQGFRREEFRGLGVPLAGRHRRLEDTIATLRQAWSGRLVPSPAGGPGIGVTPRPVAAGGPPIWIGANLEPAIRRAGKLGDGFLTTGVTPEGFAERVGWVVEALRDAGRDPDRFTFSIHLPTFAWRGADAWERVKGSAHYVYWKYDDMVNAHGRLPPSPPPPALTAEVEERLRARLVVGSPEEVAARLRQYREQVPGRFHFIARLYWPGQELAVQREALAVFAEEVIPLLR